jgi:hypothetical protein
LNRMPQRPLLNYFATSTFSRNAPAKKWKYIYALPHRQP